MRTTISFDPSVRPVYAHLEPIVDLLLANGNQLARPYRWGENRTGFYCFLSKPIDFDLIESAFVLPQTVRLARSGGRVECDVTWASIKGDMSRTAEIGQERSFDFEIKDSMSDSPGKKDGKFMSVGICFGVAIGCAIGLAIGNLALGIGPGVAIGLVIGALITKSRR
jgi:uncharacterized membrane protein